MDSPPNAPLPLHPHHHRLAWAAVVLLVVAIVIAAAYLLDAYGYIHLGNSGINGQILVALSDEPNLGLYSVDVKNHALQPFTVPLLPPGNITDAAFGPEYNYYFVTDPKTQTTEILQGVVNAKTPAARPYVVSKTFKFNVSYDPSSNTLAYLSIDPTTVSTSTGKSVWNVIVVSPASATTNLDIAPEKVIAKGQNVALLNGGLAVVEEGNELVLVNVKTDAATNMLSNIAEAPFALDPAAGTLALYNPQANAIQYFNIKSAPTASYLSSTKLVNLAPQRMLYVNHQLLLEGIQNINKNPNLLISFVANEAQYALVPLPASSATVFIGSSVFKHD